MTVDYEKAIRQLEVAKRTSENNQRVLLSSYLIMAYVGLGRDDRSRAVSAMDKFDAVARELAWEGGGARLPRPFNHGHLEALYWQASKLLGRGGQPRRGERRYGGEDDYSTLHLRSRLGKGPRKPRFGGG